MGACSTMHIYEIKQLNPITEMNRILLFLNLLNVSSSNADCITAKKTYFHITLQAISICFYLLVSRKYGSL